MYQLSIILQICRFSLAFLWVYQGLVPKIIYAHADELTMNEGFLNALPFSFLSNLLSAESLATMAGWLELSFGVLLLFAYRKKWVYKLTILAMLGLLGFVAIITPVFLNSAFNAVALNVSMIAIAMVALTSLRDNDYEWSFYD